MADDADVVQAARVSYGAGTKTPSDDRTLIRYLMRQRHTTPTGEVQVSRSSPDGLLAAVDSPSHGVRE
jgi:thymidylate synthase ThyX